MQNNTYKIVIIGESMVGKTSILLRYIKGQFIKVKTEDRTVNTNCFKKSVKTNNLTFTINIWDTAGEEKYHAMAPMFYRDADGAVIVFDYTRKDSFNLAEKWFTELREYTKNTQIILVGNKTDLENPEVTNEEARALAKKHGGVFLPVSALNGTNVDAVFQTLSLEIYHAKVKGEKKNDENKKNRMVIKDERDKKKDEGWCC